MRITSTNYNKMTPGVYKHSSSGLVTIWDVRLKTPNSGDYLTPEIIHTIEHTLYAYLKYRYGTYRVLGVYPAGSQTGFFILTRFIGSTSIFEALLDYIDSLDMTFAVPLADSESCGQYELHDLVGAKKVLKNYKYYLLAFQHSAVNYRK